MKPGRIATIIVLCVLLLAPSQKGSAQRFAIKTNVLYDVLATPDLGFELVISDHSSLGLSMFGNWTPYGLPVKMIVVQPEYRYWDSSGTMRLTGVRLC